MTQSHKPLSLAGEHRNAGFPGGRLFIVSAPSGTGKSTLCSAVRRQLGDLAYSVSYTTRPPRKGERQAVDYYFVSEAEFRRGIGEGRWAEWARVHGNFYGTSARWIEETLNSGRDILLEIDLQGARQMVKQFPDAVTIFIMPPSMEELEKRLRHRASDNLRDIDLRLENARQEIAQRSFCRHELINDEIGKAIRDLVDLIESYRKASQSRHGKNG